MSDWAIQTFDLGYHYDSNWAVRNLNLQVPTGSVFGLLGENGAGKSTTLQMLMGLSPPHEGRSEVLGLDPDKDDIQVKSRVGYVAEKPGFYEYMRVTEIIDFISAYHRQWNDDLQAELLREFALDGSTVISQLSKGMRAKLSLLLALSFEPEMLLLDEPAGGLDPASQHHFIEAILSRYQASGKTILLSSHLLNEFSGLLDHVAFIENGSVAQSASMEELHNSTKRVRFLFEENITSTLDAALRNKGAISTTLNGREASAVFNDFDEAEKLQSLQALGAKELLLEELTLEQIFIARAGA